MNEPLFAAGAEWISPGYDDEIFADGGASDGARVSPVSRWFADPPATDGRKVIITDTDHYAPGHGDALWAWKSFLRGHHPILMDFGLIGGVDSVHPIRRRGATVRVLRTGALRDGRHAAAIAERMNLIAMEPRGDLSSTGLRAGQPRRGVPRPRAGRRRSALHGQVAAGRPTPRSGSTSPAARRFTGGLDRPQRHGHKFQRATRGTRPGRPVLEQDRALTAADRGTPARQARDTAGPANAAQ